MSRPQPYPYGPSSNALAVNVLPSLPPHALSDAGRPASASGLVVGMEVEEAPADSSGGGGVIQVEVYEDREPLTTVTVSLYPGRSAPGT